MIEQRNVFTLISCASVTWIPKVSENQELIRIVKYIIYRIFYLVRISMFNFHNTQKSNSIKCLILLTYFVIRLAATVDEDNIPNIGVTLSLMIEAHIQGQRASARCDWVERVHTRKALCRKCSNTRCHYGGQWVSKKSQNWKSLCVTLCEIQCRFQNCFFFLASIVLTSILLKIKKK